MSPRRKLSVGAAVVAACSFAGGAYAASTVTTSPRQAFLSDVARRLNVSPQQLTSALQGALIDQIQAAVKAGRLTQTQANAIEQRIREHGFPLAGPFRGPPGGLWFGHGPGFDGGLLGAAASYIGISQPQLFQQLGSGKSLAQIASEHGKSTVGLENALVAALRSKLDRARAAGLITPAREQRMLTRLQSSIPDLVNRAGFGRRFGLRPGMRPFGPPGVGGPGPAGPPRPAGPPGVPVPAPVAPPGFAPPAT